MRKEAINGKGEERTTAGRCEVGAFRFRRQTRSGYCKTTENTETFRQISYLYILVQFGACANFMFFARDRIWPRRDHALGSHIMNSMYARQTQNRTDMLSRLSTILYLHRFAQRICEILYQEGGQHKDSEKKYDCVKAVRSDNNETKK